MDRLFVSSHDQNLVTVWDENTQQVLTTIPVGSQPWGIVTVNNSAYVANYGSHSVSVIDAVSLAKVSDIDTSTCPGKPANETVDTIHNVVYVAMYSGPGNVAVIDADSNTLVTCVSTGIGDTFGVAVDFIYNYLYVTNLAANNLLMYNTMNLAGGIFRNVPLDGRPYSVQVDNFTGYVYVMVARNWPLYDEPNTVFVYNPVREDPPSVLAVVGNTADGGMIWVSQATDNLYIAATASNELWIVDTTGVARAIPYPSPYGLTENFFLDRIYVGSRGAGWVGVEPHDLTPSDKKSLPVRRR